MAERVLPTGTITFLFSDMVGSTRLVSELGPGVFTEIIEQHNALLRAAFEAHGGTERGTQGDSFFVTFREAPESLAAAADAQRRLAAARWPRDADVRVRMGVHTGIARLGGDDYVGLDVHRAARIGAAAHGGQVLVSDATRVLADGSLAPGLGFLALGEHTLRDIGRPEPLHQLVIEGLPSSFPPPRTGTAAAASLPQRVTSFIAREPELEALGRLLGSAPVITITGPGGTGKTSLALELARRHSPDFANGAFWVALDSVTDASLVASTIADVMGLVESPGRTAHDRLLEALADRSVLLVLDNFEHLMPAAAGIGALSRASAGLRLVITSRAPLHLTAEQEFPLEPLALPGPIDPVATALDSPAVRLFVERARRVRPDYELSALDAPAVAEICRHLDGLPLGIELAASRIALLPASAIAERLSRRLDLPGAGARDLPERQRSLERAIAWSHELLDPAARRLLARLSVFAGGFRLEEAEAVGGQDTEPGSDLLDGLSTLVDQSLVQPRPGPDGPRYALLETIRMFAAERLAASDEDAETRRRHGLAFLALAEAAAPNLPGRNQVVWLDRLGTDIDNLRAAIRWAIGDGQAEVALRLGAALWRFWQMRGHVDEGRATMAEILAMPGAAAATRARMWALGAAGGLAWWASEIPVADGLYEAQLELGRELGDAAGIADALFNRSHTRSFLGADQAEVEAMEAEAESLYRQLGDERGLARLAWIRLQAFGRAGELEAARTLILEVLPRYRALDDEFSASLVSGMLAWIMLGLGDIREALRWGMRSVESQLSTADLASAVLGLRQVAVFLLVGDAVEEATTTFAAYRAICRRHGFRAPAYPEQLIAGLPWTTDELERAMTRPEHADAAARGATMDAFAAHEFLVDVIGRRFGEQPSDLRG